MTYPGGKGGSGVWQTIINQIPPHRFYFEPFLGAGSVMWRKRPAEFDVGADTNSGTIAFMRARLNPHYQFHERDCLPMLELMSSELACKQFVREQLETRILPPSIAASDVVVYADPPYLMSTRSEKGRRYYQHEPYLDHAQDAAKPMFGEFEDIAWHVRLLNILDALPCNVLLSGYWSELYSKLLPPPKWRVIEYTTTTRGGTAVQEFLWCNFPEPVALHDYRYLGKNRRERERIKRKVNRWTAKLAKMPTLERQSLMAALEATQ